MGSLCDADAFFLLPGWVYVSKCHTMVCGFDLCQSNPLCSLVGEFSLPGGFGLHCIPSLGSDNSVGLGMRGRKLL